MKKNIAFFLKNGVNAMGGAERILSIISSELANKGYKVTIISDNTGTPVFEINKDIKVTSLGMSFGKTKLIRKIKPIFYINKLKKILKENEIDILIPLMSESAIMSMLAKTKNIKVYPWLHDSYFDPINSNLQGKIFRKFFLSKVDKLIILNSTDYKEYKKHIEQVVRIPNPSYFNTDKVSNLENKVIISAGRLDGIKGFDSLIKAFKPVSDLHPDWKLKIFGADWGEQKNLEELISKLDLTDKAFLMGAVKNIQEEYLKSDIYAMTSKFECFPMVLLEAKECGLPIVSFDCNSGPRDIIKNGEDGYLVEDKNGEEFSKHLLKLIENKELMKEMGKNAKLNIQEFKLETVINKWIDLINTKDD